LGTVTQYNLQNVQAALGGANPISMNEYYRGGLYVPTTRNVTVTEGPFYEVGNYVWNRRSTGTVQVFWATVQVIGGDFGDVTSISTGGFTYLRGAYVTGTGTIANPFRYFVSRQYVTSVAINTGVPSSGTISISQLFGAENP
jgi:hypothetical protein